MKIPGGYGWVRIFVFGNEISADLDFYNISENPVKPREIVTAYTDINYNLQKHIQGHHLDFNMMLTDKDLSSGTQNEMTNFLQLYHDTNNTYSDRRILIYPVFDNAGSGWANVQPYIGEWVILTEEPYITDICTYKFAGQVLVLKGQTREMISEEDNKVRVYRESTTGAWSLSNAPQMGCISPSIGMTG